MRYWCKRIIELGVFIGAVSGVAVVPMCYYDLEREDRARKAEMAQMVHDAMDAAGFSPTLPNTWFKGRRFSDEIKKNASPQSLRVMVDTAKAKEYDEEIVVALQIALLASLDEVDHIVAHAKALPNDIPDSRKMLLAGILIVQNTENLEDGLNIMQDAVQLEPENLELRVGLAWMLHSAGRNDGAIAIFRDVLTNDPTNLDYVNRFAHVLMEVNLLDESEDLLLGAISREPDARTFNTLGCIRVKQGRYREALTYFEEAIERNAKHGMYYKNAALMYRLFQDRHQEMYYAQLANKYGWSVHPDANYRHIVDGD